MFLINPYIYKVSGGWKPTDISGCQMWFDASQGVTKDGSNFISLWKDQSEIANEGTQGIGVNQPLLINNALNGKPVVRFDGNNDSLVLNTPFLLEDYGCTFYSVFKTNSPGLGILFGDIDSYGIVVNYSDGNTYIGNEYGNISRPTGYLTSYCVFKILIGENNQHRMFVNGVQCGISDVGYPWNSLTHMAARIYLGQYGAIDIAEIIEYDSHLSSEDDFLVEAYLNEKYAIY